MATTFVNLTIGPTETYVNNGAVPTGGAGYQDRFTVGGTWVPGDTITILLTNNGTGLVTQIGAGYVTGVIPTYVFTYNNKVYALAGATVYMSAISDPTTWNNPNGVGNGFVTMSDYFSVMENLVAIAPYQGKLAFFSRYTTQIWVVDPIIVNWQQFQVLPNFGTFAPLSVQSLGDLDVLFLSDTGIRSLRALQYSLYATPVDIGSPIDSLIQGSLEANTFANNKAACAITDPSTGRYLLHLNGTIYVLSYFPTAKLVAWSTYLPTYDAMSALILTATAASTTQINLVWGGAVSDLGVITYNLYRSTLSGFWPLGTTPIATGLTGNTYSDTGLTQNTTYYYYALGIDVIGGQILSNEANATTQGTGSQPGTFVLTATDDVTNPMTQIDLSWTTPSGSGITYNIYRSTNPSFTPGASNIIVTGQAGTTYNDNNSGTGLANATIYYYYVIANNVNGSSTSNEAYANTTGPSILLIPYMTNYTVPSGTASASHDSGFPAYYAFQWDSVPASTTLWSSGGAYIGVFPQWVRYAFMSQVAVVTKYYVQVPTNYGYFTESFQLLGSNDNFVTYTVLDTQTGVSGSASFTVSNITAFSAFGINITAAGGTAVTSPGIGFQLSGYFVV